MQGPISYRDLRVWRQAMQLVSLTYGVVRRLPPDERFALGDQMRRAAVSVPTNIAEGNSRFHRKEYLQFLSIARGSLAELDTLFELAVDLGYLSAAETQEALSLTLQLRMPLQTLIKNQRQCPDEAITSANPAK